MLRFVGRAQVAERLGGACGVAMSSPVRRPSGPVPMMSTSSGGECRQARIATTLGSYEPQAGPRQHQEGARRPSDGSSPGDELVQDDSVTPTLMTRTEVTASSPNSPSDQAS